MYIDAPRLSPTADPEDFDDNSDIYEKVVSSVIICLLFVAIITGIIVLGYLLRKRRVKPASSVPRYDNNKEEVLYSCRILCIG